jgi:hypothetical protein
MKKPNKLTGVVRSSRIPSRVRDLWIHLLQMIKKQNKPKMWARKTKRTQMESHKDEITKQSQNTWHSRPRPGSFTTARRDVRTFPFSLLPFYFLSKQTQISAFSIEYAGLAKKQSQIMERHSSRIPFMDKRAVYLGHPPAADSLILLFDI